MKSATETKITPGNAEYQERYREILRKPLSAENVDGYAEEALGELVDLVEEIKEKHKWDGMDEAEAEREDRIFAEELPGVSVGDALERIDEIQEDLNGLDDFIAEARRNVEGRVILPPGEATAERDITGDGREAAEARTVAKTKTALFVLEQDFGVEIRDPKQLKFSTGNLEAGMMRGTSYDALELPGLERLILSNDEMGNKTYVFDTGKLAEMKITPEMIKAGTKAQIGELIAARPEAGRGLNYSENYVDRLRAAIEEVGAEIPAEDAKAEGADYLAEASRGMMPEGYISVRDFLRANAMKISNNITEFVERNQGILGEVEKFRVMAGRNGTTAYGLSPEQQESLRRQFAGKAPEGYLTMGELGREMGLGIDAIRETARRCAGELGEIQQFSVSKMGNVTKGVRYLSPEQQQIVKDALAEWTAIPVRPEDYIAVSMFFREQGMSGTMMRKIMAEHAGEIGEIGKYRSVITKGDGSTRLGAVAEFISPEQRAKLEKLVAERR